MEHIIRQYTLEPGALEVQYIEECFSEFSGKKTAEEIIERARLLALPARVVGRVGGDALALKGESGLTLSDLRANNESWLPDYMAAATPAA